MADYLSPCPYCHKNVSYKNKTIMYQLVRGLHDHNMQERVLQSGAQVEGEELPLKWVIKLSEELEIPRAGVGARGIVIPPVWGSGQCHVK